MTGSEAQANLSDGNGANGANGRISIDQDRLNRLIVSSGHDCLLVLSLDGRIQQISDSGCRLLELTSSEQINHVNWLSIWEPPERAAVRDALIGGREGRTVRFSAFGYTLKRTPRWWDTVVSPIADDGGQINLLLAVSRDITELHLREQQIRELNAQLEQRVEQRTQDLIRSNYQLHNALLQLNDLYDHAPCGYLSLDVRGKFEAINQTALGWLGWVRSEMVGQLEFRSLLQSADEVRFNLLFSWLLAGRHTEEQEYEIRRKDGSCFTALLNVSSVLDFEGRFVNCRMSMVDITARRAAENALQRINSDLERAIRERSAELVESEERFRLMVEGIEDYGIYFTDALGFITSWSTSAQSLQGYSSVEVAGQPLALLLKPDPDADALAEQRLNVARTHGQFEAYDWVTTKQGGRFWAHSVITPLRDASGHMLGFACLIHDLSEIRKIQDLQQNMNAELEDRVQERTQQLEAANAELESFSYTVSHDLRSPLRHVNHYIELGREAASQGNVLAFMPCLDQMDNSVRNMGRLIDGLLDLARLGRTALREIPLDMGLLVKEALRAVVSETESETKGQQDRGRTQWVIAPDFPQVNCDPILIRQVWSNLLSNALKYSRTRPVSHITLGWKPHTDSHAVFFVTDNGVGFDPQFSDRLFGMFQRLHSEAEFEGTGIGLALTRKIVERHQGTIWATSEKNAGCTLYFTLPLPI